MPLAKYICLGVKCSAAIIVVIRIVNMAMETNILDFLEFPERRN